MKIRFFLYAPIIAMIFMTACSRTDTDTITKKNDLLSESSDVKQEESKEEDLNEVSSSLLESSKNLPFLKQSKDEFDDLVNKLDHSVPISFEDQAYSIYDGTIGEQAARLAIWYDSKKAVIDCTYLIGNREKEITAETKPDKENKIIYDSDSVKFTFVMDSSKDLTGYAVIQNAETDEEPEDMHFTLSYIQHTKDKDNRYSIGSNEGVEQFALILKEAMLEGDTERLANYISYPFTLQVKGETISIHDREAFLKIAPAVLYRDPFQKEIKRSFTQFLYNKDGEVRFGTELNYFCIYPKDTAEEESFYVSQITVAQE